MASITKPDPHTQIGEDKKRKYRITIKRDLCIGAASCSAIAPKTFGLDDKNIVLIKEGEWDKDDLILAAAQSCPVFAIIIEDMETGKQVFPEPTKN
ncbi:ferredoxin [Candidatus Dojkabacteria bacterium]|nr:ferredoxin [Candidatus Dojkabacteria bacterium]